MRQAMMLLNLVGLSVIFIWRELFSRIAPIIMSPRAYPQMSCLQTFSNISLSLVFLFYQSILSFHIFLLT